MRQTAIMKSKQLKLGQLRLDGGTQPRSKLDYEVMDAYAEAYATGAKLPPVVVYFDGKDYWLADGFHRWWASRKAERKTILCEIREGTQQDAQWYSYAANKTHGLHRSNPDKQAAVKAAFLHPNGAKLSDGQIAEHVGVSDFMVRKYRAELTPIISESSTRTGRDGRTINTANIGKTKAAEKPASSPQKSSLLQSQNENDEPEPEPTFDSDPQFVLCLALARLENAIVAEISGWPEDQLVHAKDRLIKLVGDI